MKKSLLLLASALITLVLPSCFQSETTVHLNKDGSGTLVEETRLGTQMMAMMDQMAGLGGPAGEDPMKKMFSEEKAKARATSLGEGVTFEKSESIEADGAKGARTTYRFKDINQLKVSTEDSMKSMSPMGDMGAAANKTAPIAFTYADGKLTVKMPEPDKPEASDANDDDSEEPDMDSPEAQAMMKQMLGDMKVSLKLVIEPGISETTASHQDDKTITLMEMDMGKLVENPDNLKKLTSVKQDDPAAAMEAFKGVDGVKFEAKPEITVTLK